MRAEASGSSESLTAAYVRLTTAGLLTDPVLVEEMLRPWLERRAVRAVGDPTMAVLTAQQVIVDFGLATPSDFPSAWAMERWLEIRLAQTAALFTGATAPAPMVPAPQPPRRAWLLPVLGAPWLGRWGKLKPLPWLLAATTSTAVISGLGAIALTVGAVSGGLSAVSNQAPLFPSAGSAQVLLLPQASATAVPKAPQRSQRQTAGSGSRSLSPSAAGTTRPGATSPFQPVVIDMAPLGATPAAPSPRPHSPPSPGSASSPPTSPSPASCIPDVTAAGVVAESRGIELAAGTAAPCPEPHPELALPQATSQPRAHRQTRSIPPTAAPPSHLGFDWGRGHGSGSVVPSRDRGHFRIPSQPNARSGPNRRAGRPTARSPGSR